MNPPETPSRAFRKLDLNEKPNYYCRICDIVFRSDQELQDHFNSTSHINFTPTPKKCGHCVYCQAKEAARREGRPYVRPDDSENQPLRGRIRLQEVPCLASELARQAALESPPLEDRAQQPTNQTDAQPADQQAVHPDPQPAPQPVPDPGPQTSDQPASPPPTHEAAHALPADQPAQTLPADQPAQAAADLELMSQLGHVDNIMKYDSDDDRVDLSDKTPRVQVESDDWLLADEELPMTPTVSDTQTVSDTPTASNLQMCPISEYPAKFAKLKRRMTNTPLTPSFDGMSEYMTIDDSTSESSTGVYGASSMAFGASRYATTTIGFGSSSTTYGSRERDPFIGGDLQSDSDDEEDFFRY